MASDSDISLSALPFIPYISDDGQLPDDLNKVGIYAIFNADKVLQFVGYSRDIGLSLKQHLIRCPQDCHWLKAHTIERPKRSTLEAIEAAWVAEDGAVPPGNRDGETIWTEPVDAKLQMTADEQATYAKAPGELEQMKTLKRVARRVEEAIATQIQARGLKEQIRFDPKLKEQGLLGVKP
ncbi:MAG: GIY-YIG nuclease family protein [Elainellaceae cyanobacterium]